MSEKLIQPKVSILVPICNVEKYLGECLDSLVSQTLKDIEIICINDGSTDNSLNIIQDYAQKDSRIKVIDKPNSGYGDSMNKGLDLASGEYVGIVESDDFASEKMFEELYSIAKNNNDLDLVKSDFYYYYSKNNQVRHAGKINKNSTNKIFSIVNDASVLKIVPSIWSAIYNRKFLNENNIRFLPTPGASYQDTSFAIKTLISAKKMMFTSKAYLYYRQDNENSSVKSREKIYFICEEWDEITRFLNDKPEIKKVINAEKLITQFKAYRYNTMRILDEFRSDFVDVFSKTFSELKNDTDFSLSRFKATDKKDLNLLLNNKQGYIDYIRKRVEKNERKAKRKKFFSVKISRTRVSIILFGKQVVEIG